ncbi:hypothetical protein GQQ15_04540 [Pantoea agglomerans]|nr:hypothetical protein [Pantoea agglomerans]NEH06697.1 hypothetical protein [Pantoea agglomerans]
MLPAEKQWSYVGYKGTPRWLFYAYDYIRKHVLAHVSGTLIRLHFSICRFYSLVLTSMSA